MEMELDNKLQDQSAEQNETNREGYSRPTGNYQGEYRNVTRPQRPRIRSQRAYSTDKTSGEGGFRPEGFGAGLQNNNEGMQQPRPYRQIYQNRYCYLACEAYLRLK